MKLKIISLFVILFISQAAQAAAWTSNSNITIGLSDAGDVSTPAVFQMGSFWFLITGCYNGTFSGYNWTGTEWISNSSIVSGLGDVGIYSSPTVFQKDGVWYLISGSYYSGTFYGYNWNGTQWVTNSSIIAGLGSLGQETSPRVFYKDAIWELITGNYDGIFYGFTWNGTQWLSNASIVSGLGYSGYELSAIVIQKDGQWELISGSYYGIFYGYDWGSSQWNLNSSVVTGLGDVGYQSAPAVFQMNSIWYLISGNYDGNFSGYSGNVPPTIPKISFPTNASHHYNNSINYTWNTSTDADNDTITYDFWLSNQSDFGYTVNRTTFTNIYTGSISTTDGTIYYGRVRSYDTFRHSNWSNITQFTENTAPTVVNITLLPPSPSITDNLTISMNSTDAEGDTLTNYYLWYKNSILQSWNGTFVNYSGNYTLGDIIYVSGYVNDSYENSTELQSNTVIIDVDNSPPIFTTLTLIPSTKKNNQTININGSGISDDSASWQLQTYYKLINGSKVYITNSTWNNESSINITTIIPFVTGGVHTIYGVVVDSGNLTGEHNLSTAEKYATFTSDMTNPTVVSSSLSSSAVVVGSSVTISAQFNGQGANISSAIVRVLRPDATSANWTMTCGSGEIVNCTKVYSSTSDVGEYDISYFYPTDTAGLTPAISSTLSFMASNPSSGGGGGGGTVIINPSPTQAPLKPSLNLSLIGITDGARNMSEVAAINKCLTESLFLSNECSNAVTTTLKQVANWYTILGIPFASILVIFILNIVYPKKRSYLDAGVYSVLIIIFALSMNLMGFNIFIWNYIFNNSLSAYTFFSFMTYGFVGTVILDEFVFQKPILWKTRKLDI